MEKQKSEKELANRIIVLHEQENLGFRKIAQKLSSEGLKISKDKAWRLYREHNTTEESFLEEDEELEKLRDKQGRALEDLQLSKEKNEVRRNIASLAVQKMMEDFQERARLFTDQERLLTFSKKTVTPTDPMIWEQFTEYCQTKNYSLANALHLAVGQQEDFEEQFKNGEKLSLDSFIAFRMRHCLNAWKNRDKEKESQMDKNVKLAYDEEGRLVFDIQIARPHSEISIC